MAIPEIPDYQTIMLPLLEFAKDKKEHNLRDAVEHISNFYELTEEQRRTNLSSGNNKIKNRVGWAEIYLKKAGLLESTKRSFFKITERGLDVLKQNPKEITNKYLEKFPEFVDWIKTTKKQDVAAKSSFQTSPDKPKTPDELIEENYKQLNKVLADNILNSIKKREPQFLEKLVLKLLSEMGYGDEEDMKHTGKSGDGGIDGIIPQDKLGLDNIYIQAKKHESSIQEPALRDFAGALLNKRGIKKGIFITTSTFSEGAREYVKTIDHKIVLIDGYELANLMIKHNIGVSTSFTYEVKEIDNDYFEE